MYLDFVVQKINIPFYTNLQTNTLGMDSKQHCFNAELFDASPPVSYQFNQVGFRTHNIDQFNSNAILVLGDSFTLGLGVNSADRFSDIIEQRMRHQVLNFSLNGASNDWIARKLQQLLTMFQPRAVIVHYTFSHRRERPNLDWLDDERTECEPFYSSQENFNNWTTNFNCICRLAKNVKLIHSFIPNWHNTVVDYTQFGEHVLSPQTQLDCARDGFHYGPLTHRLLADKITSLLACE
jgi:hypothetical protein